MTSLTKLLEVVKNSATFRRAKHASQHDLELLRQLVEWREKRGLKQKDLADIMGVTQQQISKFEAHDNDPKLSSLRRYANALELVIHHHVLDDSNLKVSCPNDNWTTGHALTVRVESVFAHSEHGRQRKSISEFSSSGRRTDVALIA